mmetsp:Transcript_33284/g.43893  ORF Transcript_33284/g.43893 Transcript_33284/m.43893 type:complete len:218 (+) Transcript_33284:893-1546(+)
MISKPRFSSLRVFLTTTTNHVVHQSPWGSREPNQRHLSFQLFFDCGDGLNDMAQFLADVNVCPQTGKILWSSQRSWHYDSFPSWHFHINTKCFRNHQNIREKNCCIHFISSDWLHCHFCYVCRVLKKLQEVFIFLFFIIHVFREMPSCLSKKPNWSTFDFLSFCSTDNQIILKGIFFIYWDHFLESCSHLNKTQARKSASTWNMPLKVRCEKACYRM